MTGTLPVKSDPDIAAAVFESDLTSAMGSARAAREAWELIRVSPLRAIVKMSGRVPEAESDDRLEVSDDHAYYVRLDADWYPQHPPLVTFAEHHADWPVAGAGSPWLPVIEQTHPGFALHVAYQFPDGIPPRQLICSSINLDYYWTHQPEEGKVWTQGRDTLMWTLSVIQDELSGKGYRGRTSALHP